VLADLADKITPFELELAEKVKFNSDYQNSPIFIIAHGEVNQKYDDMIISTLKKGSVYGDLFQEGPPTKSNVLEARERTIVFKINLMDFYFIMANHHELVQGLIKNITGQNNAEYSQTTKP